MANNSEGLIYLCFPDLMEQVNMGLTLLNEH